MHESVMNTQQLGNVRLWRSVENWVVLIKSYRHLRHWNLCWDVMWETFPDLREHSDMMTGHFIDWLIDWLAALHPGMIPGPNGKIHGKNYWLGKKISVSYHSHTVELNITSWIVSNNFLLNPYSCVLWPRPYFYWFNIQIFHLFIVGEWIHF